MPTSQKNTGPKVGRENETNEAASAPKTGPNVDNGYVAGLVTVDPETAQGRAAKATRDSNSSKETQHDDGTIEVTHGDLGDTVEEKVAEAKKANPSTIANTKKDVVGDPKADVQ